MGGSVRIEPGIISRLLFRNSAIALEATDSALIITLRSGQQNIPYQQLHRVEEHRGWFRSTLSFQFGKHPSQYVTARGIHRAPACRFRGVVLERQVGRLVPLANRELHVLVDADRFLNHRTWINWDNRYRPLLKWIPADADKI